MIVSLPRIADAASYSLLDVASLTSICFQLQHNCLEDERFCSATTTAAQDVHQPTSPSLSFAFKKSYLCESSRRPDRKSSLAPPAEGKHLPALVVTRAYTRNPQTSRVYWRLHQTKLSQADS